MIALELFGAARALAGAPQVELDLAEPARVADVLRALVARYPALRDVVVTADGALVPPNVVLLDGKRAANGEALVCERDKPCLVFVPSGG